MDDRTDDSDRRVVRQDGDVHRPPVPRTDGGDAPGEPTVVEERSLSGMRRTIATRLGESYREAVHVTVNRGIEAEALFEATAAADDALDVDVSLPDVLLLALSATLDDHPDFNATFEENTHRIYAEHNVGIAIDVGEGLIAPVLRDVGSLSLSEIATRRRELTEDARNGEYTMSDLRGGTFTVSNLGPLGVESFDPVINPPQIAILGVNAVEDRPRPDGSGGVEFRRYLPLSLSFDHRIVDGADAAAFLETLATYAGDPWPLLPDGVDAGSDDPTDDETHAGDGGAVLPRRKATAYLEDDLSGRVEAGGFDRPFDGGSAPTPVDAFLGAFASCLAASIGVQAEIREVELDDLSVDAVATPETGHVESISLSIRIDAPTDDDTLERIVEMGDRTCHVAALLREDLPVELSWQRAGE